MLTKKQETIVRYLFLMAVLRLDQHLDLGYNFYFKVQMLHDIALWAYHDLPSKVGSAMCSAHNLPNHLYWEFGFLQCMFGFVFSCLQTRLQIMVGLGEYLAVVSELPDLLL